MRLYEAAVTGAPIPLTVISNETAVVGVAFRMPMEGSHPCALALNAAAQLREYFRGKRSSFTVPHIFLHGTAFQQQVWQATAGIPYGTVCTYGEIAATVGRPNAVRAVGSAVGKNPLPILIPCHRVVAAHSIGGFTPDISIKRILLQGEGICYE